MTEDRIKAWGALAVAVLSIIGVLRSELGAQQQRSNDAWIVEVLARELAASQAKEGCK